jgi:hypothetical protein
MYHLLSDGELPSILAGKDFASLTVRCLNAIDVMSHATVDVGILYPRPGGGSSRNIYDRVMKNASAMLI